MRLSRQAAEKVVALGGTLATYEDAVHDGNAYLFGDHGYGTKNFVTDTSRA